jgi:hypothetical protein
MSDRRCPIIACPYAPVGKDGKCRRHTRDAAARPSCTEDGCKRPHQARGLCQSHYSKAREAGTLHLHAPLGLGSVEGRPQRHRARRVAADGKPKYHHDDCACPLCAAETPCPRCFLRGAHECLPSSAAAWAQQRMRDIEGQ